MHFLKYEKSHWLITRLSTQTYFVVQQSLKIIQSLEIQTERADSLLLRSQLKQKVDFFLTNLLIAKVTLVYSDLEIVI